MEVQQTMFPDLAPEVELVPLVEAGTDQAPDADWFLLGRRSRSPSWHIMHNYTGGVYGVRTFCGLSGWPIVDPGSPVVTDFCVECHKKATS